MNVIRTFTTSHVDPVTSDGLYVKATGAHIRLLASKNSARVFVSKLLFGHLANGDRGLVSISRIHQHGYKVAVSLRLPHARYCATFDSQSRFAQP